MTNRITDIQFQSKFIKKMKFPSTPSFENFKSFFVGILNEDEEFVLGLLWILTYAPDGQDVPKTYWLICDVLLKFSDQQRQAICSELRHQYKQLHADFLKVDVEGNVAQSYTKLVNVANEITAYQVLQKCLQYKNLPVESVKHCSELLRDEKENRYFGGLRDLGFNKKSANYLKPFIKEIAQLFKDITAENNAQEDDIVSSLPFMLGGEDTPVQNGCEVQAVQDDVEVQTPREDDVEVQTHLEADKNQLSAVFALQHKTELDNFFKALEEVESIGLTAELILSKRAEIEQLLRVSTLF